MNESHPSPTVTVSCGIYGKVPAAQTLLLSEPLTLSCPVIVCLLLQRGQRSPVETIFVLLEEGNYHLSPIRGV